MDEENTSVPAPPDSSMPESLTPPWVKRLDLLETRVADLEKEGVALRSELAAARRTPYPPPPGRSVPTSGIVPPADPRVWPIPPPPPPNGGGSSVGLLVGGPSPATRPATKPAIEFTTEMAMKWAGLVLLFLAAAFMVSTAVSRGWIGPRLQLVGAIVGGLALIAGGLKLRDREGWGESLVFVGLAVLFVCAGASWEWLDLGSAGLAAAMAVLVGALAIALARYMSAWTLALVALFGLIIDPIWLGLNNSLGLGISVLYLLIILGIFTFLYLEQRWAILWVFSAVFTALLVLQEALDGPWGEARDSQVATTVGITTVVLLGGLLAIYWFGPVAASIVSDTNRHSRSSDPSEDGSVANADLGPLSLGGMEHRVVLLAPAWYWFCVREFTSMERNESIILGLVLFVLAAASAMLTRTKVPKAFFATQCVAASIVLAIVLALAFDGPVLLVAFGLQAALLLALIRDLDDVWFTLQALFAGGLTLLVTTGRMLEALFDDAAWTDDLAHLLVVALIAVLGVLELRHSRGTVGASTGSEPAETMGQLAILAAYVGLLGWVATVFGHMTQGQGQVSAIWSLLAAGLLAIALIRKSNKILQAGLATFGLVVAKLLTVDLAAVDTFWRVGLFFVIGSGLLALSYQLPRLMGAANATPSNDAEPSSDAASSNDAVPSDGTAISNDTALSDDVER